MKDTPTPQTVTPEAMEIIETQKKLNNLFSYTKGLTDAITSPKLLRAQGLFTKQELDQAVESAYQKGAQEALSAESFLSTLPQVTTDISPK